MVAPKWNAVSLCPTESLRASLTLGLIKKMLIPYIISQLVQILEPLGPPFVSSYFTYSSNGLFPYNNHISPYLLEDAFFLQREVAYPCLFHELSLSALSYHGSHSLWHQIALPPVLWSVGLQRSHSC